MEDEEWLVSVYKLLGRWSWYDSILVQLGMPHTATFFVEALPVFEGKVVVYVDAPLSIPDARQLYNQKRVHTILFKRRHGVFG